MTLKKYSADENTNEIEKSQKQHMRISKKGIPFSAGRSTEKVNIATDISLKIKEIKKFLQEDMGYKNWKEFVDGQSIGDCQYIAESIAKKFPEFKEVFGEIITDESYNDEDGEEQDRMTHHWVEYKGEIYDFAKGSLEGYVQFNDKYNPKVEDDSIYKVIRKRKRDK